MLGFRLHQFLERCDGQFLVGTVIVSDQEIWFVDWWFRCAMKVWV